MLLLAILFGTGSMFFNYSKKHDLNKVLWTILGPASYFLGQVLAGIIIGLVAPELLYETGAIMVIGLLSGFSSIAITYFIMKSAASKRKENDSDNDILDENINEDELSLNE